MAEITCIICGTKKYRRPGQVIKGGGKYCSRQCLGISQRNDYGTLYQSHSKRPRTENGKQVLVYNLIAENVLGRPLKVKPLGDPTGEVVHHINRDRSDNRNCNLLICTQSYHVGLHNKMRHKEGPWKTQ